MSSFQESDAGSTFAGTPGQTYWDEGIESSILALQRAAAATSNPDFVKRANDLQQRLTNAWFPIVQGLLIKGDALQLDDDIKAVTGTSSVYQLDPGIGGVYAVAPPDVEAQVGGDVAANVDALGTDVATSARQLADKAKPAASKLLQYGGALLLLLLLFYTYEAARRG